jgi:hypothetical protein
VHIGSVTVERDVNNRNIIVDSKTNETHSPNMKTQRVSGKNVDVGTDYGLIIRVKNPFNPKRNILMISGAYGYGVVAGIQVCIAQASELHKKYPHGFEAIVEYSMTEGPPGIAKIKTERSLFSRRRSNF